MQKPLRILRHVSNRGTRRLAKRVLEARFGAPRPLILSHSLTNRCNADCETCLWKEPANAKSDELSTDEIGRLYVDAGRLGFRGVTVWGGEPTLRKDLGENLQRALAAGMETTIITNGFSLVRRGHEYLPHTRRLCVSIDGEREHHDLTRRVPGLYDRIIEGLELVRRDYPRIRIVIGCVITRRNMHSLDHVADIARKFGAHVLYHVLETVDYAALPMHTLDVAKLELTRDEEVQLFTKLSKLARKDHVIQNLPDFFDTLAKGPVSYSCHYKKVVLRIEANGEIRDCSAKDGYLGSIRETPIADFIDGPIYRDFLRRTENCGNLCRSPAMVSISRILEGRPAPLRDAVVRGVQGSLG